MAKNADKPAGSLRKGIRNAALAALVVLPGGINDASKAISNIKNPTPAIAQAPDFKSQTDYTLIPSTPPQPPTEASTLKSTPESSSIPSTPSLTETPKPPEYEYLTSGNVKVAIDKEGSPVEYILPDGKKVAFDKEEVKQIRGRAISEKEPEIISVVTIDRPSQFSAEHPKITELPEDILSEEELEKRGVKLNQADNITLYIRQAAFEKGAPLADFNNTGRNLTISLIRNPNIRNKNMTEEELRAKGIKNEEQNVRISRFMLKDLRKSPNDHNFDKKIKYWEEDMLYSKTRLFRFKELHTRDELLELLSHNDRSVLKAEYHRGNNPKIKIYLGNPYHKDILTFSFSSKGEFNIFNSSIDIRESYPNPADFQVNTLLPRLRLDYAIGNASTNAMGFVLQHELAHDELLQQRINKGESPNKSEHDADMRAIEGITTAWEKWEKSGFTDNSEYYFVFSLPKEGRYIITKERQSDAKTPTGL